MDLTKIVRIGVAKIFRFGLITCAYRLSFFALSYVCAIFALSSGTRGLSGICSRKGIKSNKTSFYRGLCRYSIWFDFHAIFAKKNQQKRQDMAQAINTRDKFTLDHELSNEILLKLENTPDLQLFKDSLTL